jgi:hypothetical protein
MLYLLLCQLPTLSLLLTATDLCVWMDRLALINHYLLGIRSLKEDSCEVQTVVDSTNTLKSFSTQPHF